MWSFCPTFDSPGSQALNEQACQDDVDDDNWDGRKSHGTKYIGPFGSVLWNALETGAEDEDWQR